MARHRTAVHSTTLQRPDLRLRRFSRLPVTSQNPQPSGEPGFQRRRQGRAQGVRQHESLVHRRTRSRRCERRGHADHRPHLGQQIKFPPRLRPPPPHHNRQSGWADCSLGRRYGPVRRQRPGIAGASQRSLFKGTSMSNRERVITAVKRWLGADKGGASLD